MPFKLGELRFNAGAHSTSTDNSIVNTIGLHKAMGLLVRHQKGDWGVAPKRLVAQNERTLRGCTTVNSPKRGKVVSLFKVPGSQSFLFKIETCFNKNKRWYRTYMYGVAKHLEIQ